MGYDKQKVISIALAEEGYLEKSSKSNLDDKTANAGDKNYTKYARDLAAIGYFNGNKQGAAWCSTFVSWCFVKAYGKTAALKLQCQPTKGNCGAGCKYALNYYKAKGQLFDTPKVGDQIFFWSSTLSSISHTALVYKVDSSYVYTIEGNTSSANGVIANGGAVAKKKYRLTYNRIAGYGRPAYGTQESTTVEDTPSTSAHTTYVVQQGDTLWGIAKSQLGAGIRYKEIMELNGLKSSLIRIGQVLKIPKND